MRIRIADTHDSDQIEAALRDRMRDGEARVIAGADVSSDDKAVWIVATKTDPLLLMRAVVLAARVLAIATSTDDEQVTSAQVLASIAELEREI